MEKQLPTVKAIFDHAHELESLAERRAYLDQACADAPYVRRKVEDLLKAYDEAGSFLESPPESPGTVDLPPVTEGLGSRIGPYKLLQQIGEGGMGVVYMAEQERPVRRRVAVKIIKPGMDSAQVIARFEAERQALAIMDHANIAHVFDAGTTGTNDERGTINDEGNQNLDSVSSFIVHRSSFQGGRPYFVMELVHGVPITTYCDENKLSPRQRLELFVPVCQAIQHAHQKGIIHRDLKPSNIMVTLHDGTPVPKVIDFGVAKATEQRLTERTLFTQYGTIVGTFEYMAPEQAEMSGLGVDTRSDIYTLGVLLYELLTGSTPLNGERLRKAAYSEMMRMIKEEEPPRPSLRLSSSGAALATISQQRGTEPAKLTKLVRGELDWIVMKCLEKDRTRRYETANGLARDIQRYLADEPVEACPPSAAYLLRKMVRKHKKALAVASAFAALLISAFVLVTWKWIDERKARDDAVASRLEAEATAHRIQTDAERMNAANAAMDLGDFYLNHSRWSEAEAEYTKATKIRVDHSSVWLRRAEFYAQLGLWDLVTADRMVAFQLREPESATDWYLRSLMLLEGGDTSGYRRLCQRIFDRFAESTDHFEVYILLRTCALDAAAPIDVSNVIRLALKMPAATTGSGVSVRAFFLGTAYYRAGRFDDAVNCCRRSLEETTWPWRPINYPMLAMALQQKGKHDEARQELANTAQNIEQWTKEVFEVPDKFVPVPFWWDWVECQRFFREACTLIEGKPRPEDPRLRIIRGRAFAALKRHNQADAEYAEAVKLAPNAPHIRLARARYFTERGQSDKAKVELTTVVQLRPDDPQVYLDVFRFLADRGHAEKAAAAHAKAIELRPSSAEICLERFRYYAERGEEAQADTAYAEIRAHKPDDPSFRLTCGDLCSRMGQWKYAEQEFAKAVELGVRDAQVLRSAAAACMKQRRWEAAIQYLDLLLKNGPAMRRDWANRGQCHAELGQRTKAAADYAETIKQGGTNVWEVLQPYAALCVHSGQLEEYRRVRELALIEHIGTADPWLAAGVVIVCHMVDEPVDAPRVERLLRIADGNPAFRCLRAQHLYRHRDFEGAAKLYEAHIREAPEWLANSFIKLDLAMILQQLGRNEEARKRLTEATAWLDKNDGPEHSWDKRLNWRKLRGEAEALILNMSNEPEPVQRERQNE